MLSSPETFLCLAASLGVSKCFPWTHWGKENGMVLNFLIYGLTDTQSRKFNYKTFSHQLTYIKCMCVITVQYYAARMGNDMGVH